MTENNNEIPQEGNPQGFQKASDAAFGALRAIKPAEGFNEDESKREIGEAVERSESASVPEGSSEAHPQETTKEASENVVPPIPSSDNVKQEYVSPHVYGESKGKVPTWDSIPTNPLHTPVVVEAPSELSHKHKPWFYSLTGGLAGFLIGAACVAGCTSIALHTGYVYQDRQVSTQEVQGSAQKESDSSARNDRGSREADSGERGYDPYGYRGDRGYGVTPSYPNPYSYDYGYGYGVNPYGYDYGYGYPYGYNYGYSNPYGYPYDYGYTNPYGYSYDYSPYGYDIYDLLEELYGSGSGDEYENGSQDSRNNSQKDDTRESEEGSRGYGYFDGFLDTDGLLDERSSDGSSYGEILSIDDIIENYGVDMGSVEGDTFGAGVYEVGKDGIEPGLYYLGGSQTKESNVYIYNSARGDYKLAAAIAYFGNYFVELDEGDVIVYKPGEDSQEFFNADRAPEVEKTGSYDSGVYRVGVDIPAGTYKITASSDKLEEASQERGAYVMNDLDFEEDSIEETKYVMPGGIQTIEVEDGQWLELYGAHAELQN